MGLMDKAKDFLSSESGKQKTSEFLDKAKEAVAGRRGEDNTGKERFEGGESGRTDTPPSQVRPEEPGVDDARGTDAPGAAGGEGNPRP